MGVWRLSLTVVAAFGAGVVGFVTALAVLSAAELLEQGTLSAAVLLVSSFGPTVAVAVVVGRRLSPTGAVTAPAPPPVETPLGGLDALRAELGRERADERSGQLAAVLLALFVLQGLSDRSLRSLLVLVAVLLVHEGGHALGMLAFGYRDVRVFFLPYFGAAVTGRKADAPVWQRVVVLLLGPVPGVVLGMALLVAARGEGLLAEIGLTAVWVNVFNLLPFEPLDGGRVLGVTLFSRWRWLEATFAALGALGLVGVGRALGSWMLVAVAALALLGVPRRLRVGAAVQRLGARGLPIEPRPEELSEEALAAFDQEASVLLGARARTVPTRAAAVRELHGRVLAAPPGALLTLLLLGAYAGGVLVSVVALVLAVQLSPARSAAPGPAAPTSAPPR